MSKKKVAKKKAPKTKTAEPFKLQQQTEEELRSVNHRIGKSITIQVDDALVGALNRIEADLEGIIFGTSLSPSDLVRHAVLSLSNALAQGDDDDA